VDRFFANHVGIPSGTMFNQLHFHRSSDVPSEKDLKKAKPPEHKSLFLLRLPFGRFGSFGLRAIRNRQVASSSLALGSNFFALLSTDEDSNSI